MSLQLPNTLTWLPSSGHYQTVNWALCASISPQSAVPFSRLSLRFVCSSSSSSEYLLELKAKYPLRVETVGNSEANSSCWRVKSVPSRFNETRNTLNTLTASISLLFVRSKMAVCTLNRKRDSLYPLTLQPAYHFRTQNCLIKVWSFCWVLHSPQEQSKNNSIIPKWSYINVVLVISSDTTVKLYCLPPVIINVF